MQFPPRAAGPRARPRAAAAPAGGALLGLMGVLLAACGETPATVASPGANRVADVAAQAGAVKLPLRVAADLLVRAAEFGVLETTAEGEERFVPTSELPAVEGTTFGWVLHVDTRRATLHWQEHLRLPRAPADWGDAAEDPDVLISRDGTSVAAHGEDAVEDGELERFYWTLASGDPAGDYELDVALEGRTVAQFRFRVPAPVHEQAILVAAPRPPVRQRARALRVAHGGGAESVASGPGAL